MLYLRGASAFAHRISYALHNGPLVEGMEIDHICSNKLCVNPTHLAQVSTSENMRRANLRRRLLRAAEERRSQAGWYTRYLFDGKVTATDGEHS